MLEDAQVRIQEEQPEGRIDRVCNQLSYGVKGNEEVLILVFPVWATPWCQGTKSRLRGHRRAIGSQSLITQHCSTALLDPLCHLPQLGGGWFLTRGTFSFSWVVWGVRCSELRIGGCGQLRYESRWRHKGSVSLALSYCVIWKAVLRTLPA